MSSTGRKGWGRLTLFVYKGLFSYFDFYAFDYFEFFYFEFEFEFCIILTSGNLGSGFWKLVLLFGI